MSRPHCVAFLCGPPGARNVLGSMGAANLAGHPRIASDLKLARRRRGLSDGNGGLPGGEPIRPAVPAGADWDGGPDLVAAKSKLAASRRSTSVDFRHLRVLGGQRALGR